MIICLLVALVAVLLPFPSATRPRPWSRPWSCVSVLSPWPDLDLDLDFLSRDLDLDLLSWIWIWTFCPGTWTCWIFLDFLATRDLDLDLDFLFATLTWSDWLRDPDRDLEPMRWDHRDRERLDLNRDLELLFSRPSNPTAVHLVAIVLPRWPCSMSRRERTQPQPRSCSWSLSWRPA